MLFQLFRKNRITEGDPVDLKLESHREPSFSNNYVPSDIYGIFLHGSSMRIGECDIRLGMNEELYYAGNIGYRIYEPYRGHGYAYEAAKMLMRIAREIHGFDEIILTCSPDNIASRKTLEKLGGVLVETVNVPSWHWLYKRGETVKQIWRYDLKNMML
ncbi:MAG: GNAT family N-acetyltransferase [Erysipelotrichaceae bacterium]|jgi:predicted acetyltransferase|nr:GNAT family N-acetyltransferase [Erysipelotrichaceae bacterium]